MSSSADQITYTQKTVSRLDESTQYSARDFQSGYVNPENIRYASYDVRRRIERERARKKAEEASRKLALEIEKRKRKEEEDLEALKDAGKFLLKTAAISAAVLGGIAIIVPAIGFGSAGVTAGSLAASYQSAALGGTIASGSTFATLQSVGAAGLAASTKAGIVAGSGIVAAATTGNKTEKDKQQNNSRRYENISRQTSYKDVENDFDIEIPGFRHVATQTMPTYYY